jgi:hypothetical protein
MAKYFFILLGSKDDISRASFKDKNNSFEENSLD